MLNEAEKQKSKELLDELTEIRGPGPALDFWKIKAQTLLVFIVWRRPELIFEQSQGDE